MLTPETLRHLLTSQCHVTDRAPLLVAVSGGADSMALLDLLRQTDWPVVAAHCNFRLRGSESDGDEAFVRHFCASHGIECHVRGFDTRAFAAV